MATDNTDAYESLIQFLYRAPIGLAQTNLAGDIEMINPMSAALLMPLSRDGGLDNLFAVLEDVAPQLRAQATAFGELSGVVREPMRIALPVPADGAAGGPEVLSFSLMKLDATRLMAVLSDATLEVRREQQMLAGRLRDASRVDVLTQMPNRPAILDHINQRLATTSQSGADFAVLFMNCDRLSQINDSVGHAVGDQVLSQMAGRLRATLRQGDRVGRQAASEGSNGQMAARVGGDEFVVVLEDLRWPDDALTVGQRLLQRLAQPYEIGAHQLFCSVSMGIAPGRQAVGDATALMQDARLAMVEAKRAGGARFVAFEAGMRQRAELRGALETDLHRALTQQEFFVVYQPVVGLQGAAGIDPSTGVEALVRWRHPTRGIVPPFEFIGVAEQCGLIGAIGDFVLAESCRQFVAWQAELGASAPRLVAVNLSRAQLRPGFATLVQEILRTTGMPVGQLQLEITESLAAQDETIQARLHELKALGLKLALDDFGTGYSSLASLHLLPVDTVKIDRSFVCKADTSQHHRVLIDATVRVARSLGMTTVAEGVETEAQHRVIRELGCDKGQGYLYSRPRLPEDMAAWTGAALLV
jgi:diguanylate cyclase (GGDEF)-like protein